MPELLPKYLCVVCHFRVEQDDVKLRHLPDKCVCVPCYVRLTESQLLPLEPWYRHALESAIAAL